MINLLLKTIYHPVKARVIYDFLAAVVSSIGVWLLLNLFSISTAHLKILLLYPAFYILFNYFLGIYSHLKTAHILVKTVVLSISSLLSLFALYIVIQQVSLDTVLLTLAVATLTILPRICFHFTQSSNKTIYFNTIAHAKLPVLVVGGGGYIGSHVVNMLLKKGYKVRVFDKFLYGKEALSEFKDDKNLEIIEGDISDLFKLTLALENVQSVIHLAGLVGDPACAIDDKLTRHINIVSTRMLKEIVKAFRIPRFIFASSCSVYGASSEIVNEDSNLNPVSLYAKTKIDSEEEILNDSFDNFHPTILRFATVFGHSRRMRFDLVVNLFSAQAYHNGTITVTGSHQWRPFVHVGDVAKAVIKTLEAPLEKVSRQIFNVGDEKLNITIGELADVVGKVISQDKKGKDVKIVTKDDITDNRNYNVSFNKIKTVLGFEASTTLSQGVEEMYENFKMKTYKKPYTDASYSNFEMTKEMKKEFYSESYQKTHFSPMAENVQE